MVLCAGPGQRERVDRSLVPSHIRVVQGGQRRTSAAPPSGGGGGGGGRRQPTALIPTGYQHQPPGIRLPTAVQTQHSKAPSGKHNMYDLDGRWPTPYTAFSAITAFC